ncbi:ABC transporter substrate-binding protein [Paenibacillus alkalitolerans]|uniref:ABC transporter substrate-binding protein n=1 Tax=Paenibacillus alkalitolerans TaxID=2799335 RepID=UPI0018F3A48C|nr:extracellular solute-binding protein [Paenibacillus alkalitolerans]
MKVQAKKTWLSILLLIAIVVVAGCSGGGGAAGPKEGAAAEGQTGDSDSAEKPETSPEALTATIKVWDWDETFLTTMIPEFNKKYPGIKVEYTVVNPNDYLQKLQSGIASGSDVPDVILGETAYRGKLFDLDVLDNLEQAPYSFDRSQLLDYLIPLMSNSRGEIVGIDQQITPAGFAYRRDLAKEYLGTDVPEELEQLLPDWDAFIAKGKEAAEKSGGKVTMLPGLGDAFLALRGQTAKPYINGTEIDLTSRMQEPLAKLFEMRDAGILGKHELWTPSWSASMASGENIFYPMAPWGPKWHISANDPEGSGRWGLVKAPGGSFTRGGTSISIYKDSKVKEAAWAYVNFMYLSDEGTKLAYKKFGVTPGIKSFYETNKDLIEQGSEYDAFFGGQNLAKYFIEKIVTGVTGEPQSKYESIVEGAFMSLYPLWTKDTGISSEQALEKFIAEVKNKAAGATVK